MAYSSRYKKRPFEAASKSSHSRLIHSQAVREYLEECQSINPRTSDIKPRIFSVEYPPENNIRYVVAVDSGSVGRIAINGGNSELATMQFGVMFFKMANLEALRSKSFISQQDLRDLKEGVSGQLVLPLANVTYRKNETIRDSFRMTIYEFFKQYDLLTTLKWILCKEFNPAESEDSYNLGRCPNAACTSSCSVPASKMEAQCTRCAQPIFITDSLGLHESISEEVVPQEVISQTAYLLEMVIIFDNIKRILDNPKAADKFSSTLFLIDGQLMTRRLTHFSAGEGLLKTLRSLTKFLLKNHGLNLIAIEKSGYFVRYADSIGRPQSEPAILKRGEFILLDGEFIYDQIIPGDKTAPAAGYGAYTHYGSKIIFKDAHGRVYVLTTPPWSKHPTPPQFPNLHNILAAIERLKCDSYDNSLLPVALINKYISLSFNPSRNILRKFLSDKIYNPR